MNSKYAILRGQSNLFESILEKKNLSIYYQPVFSLISADLLGYEAFCRGPSGTVFDNNEHLFQMAELSDKKVELEHLCKSMQLQHSADITRHHLLFLNFATDTMMYYDIYKLFKTDNLRTIGISHPHNIILEVSSAGNGIQAHQFGKAVRDYSDMGFKTCADKVGGLSFGVNYLCDSASSYIKLDMSLVRDIDKSEEKKALAKSLCQFCSDTNKKVIAVGIQTLDELMVLIDMGVQYGQGFLLGEPMREVSQGIALSSQLTEFILAENKKKFERQHKHVSSLNVGEICKKCPTLLPDATGEELMNIFNGDPLLQGVPIAVGGKVSGLIMKEKFLMRLATQYGMSLYMKRQVNLLMEKDILVVNYDDHFYDVSKFATARSEDKLYDYIIVYRNDRYYGIVTVKDLLNRSIKFEASMDKHINFLTGLPDKPLVDKKLSEALNMEKSFFVLMAKLDLTRLIDQFGYENVENIIRVTGIIIQKQIALQDSGDNFVGYIGAGEFIIVRNDVITATLRDKICSELFNYLSSIRGASGVVARENIQHTNTGTALPLLNIGITFVSINNENGVFSNKYEIYDALYKENRSFTGKHQLSLIEN